MVIFNKLLNLNSTPLRGGKPVKSQDVHTQWVFQNEAFVSEVKVSASLALWSYWNVSISDHRPRFFCLWRTNVKRGPPTAGGRHIRKSTNWYSLMCVRVEEMPPFSDRQSTGWCQCNVHKMRSTFVQLGSRFFVCLRGRVVYQPCVWSDHALVTLLFFCHLKN